MEKQSKLSEVEINKLFRFAEKKMVPWYDLQIEIVDHLATNIEDEMAADSKLTFGFRKSVQWIWHFWICKDCTGTSNSSR